MSFFEGFEKIKYYAIIMGGLFIGYAWAGVSGTKITGDDNNLKEEQSERREGRNFYHK